VASAGKVIEKVTLAPKVDGFSEEARVGAPDPRFTTWESGDETAELWLESPPYCAVIEWVPTDSVVVEKLAVPPDTVPVPSTVVPSRNCTVPVAPAGTVAVKVTELPDGTGLRDDATVTVVAVLFTTCASAADVTPL
jgi:hypothetical protein